MKKMLLTRLAFLAMLGSLFFFNSCGVLNPNIMLHADRHYVYDTLSKDTTIGKELKIGPNDIIEFRLFANDGFKMIDIISSSGNSTANSVLARQGFEYTVDYQGNVVLPVIGTENLNGMTIREAETYLEKRYSEFYVHPFVLIKVLNQRIIIFPGEPGQAKVLTLGNNNTTLLEALALAGGISANGKAYNIKLIRQMPDRSKKPKVYKIDLSKIDGIAQGNTVLQSGDIIYVEPRRQLAGKALNQITPVLSLFSSLFSIYFITKRL
jgi:polysaccharide export outer membrane protein